MIICSKLETLGSRKNVLHPNLLAEINFLGRRLSIAFAQIFLAFGTKAELNHFDSRNHADGNL